MALELSKDPTAGYFAGPWAHLALLAPFFATAGHMAHVVSGRLSLAPALLGTIPGPFLLAVVANAYVRSTLNELPDILASQEDCAWYDVKEQLELSWRAAERVYIDCLSEHEIKFQDLERLFRIQECHHYLQGHLASPTPSFQDMYRHALYGPQTEWHGVKDAFAPHRVAWRYLERLEEEQHCSGWCRESRALWTAHETRDSCSAVAGFVMKHKVRPTAYVLLTYSASILLVAPIGLGLLVTNGVMYNGVF